MQRRPQPRPVQSIRRPRPGAQREVSIWQYLTFLLGLIPAAIAILRVVLTAQGDDATFYTLVRTLDVPALVIATYGRFIGVLGVGVTLPLLLYSSGRARSIKLNPPGPIILWILLACSIACIYSEELFDYTVISPWPVDIFRALGWALAVYWPASWWEMWRAGRKPGKKHLAGPLRWLAPAETILFDLAARMFGLMKKAFSWAAKRLDTAAELITGHRVETWVIAPALALLLWSYLLGNNRIWLPAQVVGVRPSPTIIAAAPALADKSSDLGSERLANGDWAFVAYILSQDCSGFTILTVTGHIIDVPAGGLTDQVPCQFEPDYDPGYDRPLLFSVPFVTRTGHGAAVRSSNQTCLYWMKHPGDLVP